MPGEHVIDPWSAPLAYALQAVAHGVEVRRSVEVLGGEYDGEAWTLQTSQGAVRARWVINCAGLFGDVVQQRLTGASAFQIKQVQQQLGATVVYVTHDQDEALTMSDRVAVMKGGRIVQVGSPRDLYDRPANLFVAGFVGEMNVLSGRLLAREADGWRVELPGGSCMVRHEAPGAQPGESVVIAVRPERVQLSSGDLPAEPGCAVQGTLLQTVFNGASISLLVQQPDGTMVRADRSAASPATALPEPGSTVRLAWRPEDSHLFAPPA